MKSNYCLDFVLSGGLRIKEVNQNNGVQRPRDTVKCSAGVSLCLSCDDSETPATRAKASLAEAAQDRPDPTLLNSADLNGDTDFLEDEFTSFWKNRDLSRE